MRQDNRGSIAIFMALILLVLTNLFFSMVEAVRIYEYHMEARVLASKLCADAFSEYEPYMWQEYGILGLDMAYGHSTATTANVENRMLDFAEDRRDLEVTDVTIDSYGLLTDDGGKPFIKQCAMAALAMLPQEALDKLQAQIQAVSEIQDEDMDIDDMVGRGVDAIEEAQASIESADDNEKDSTSLDESVETDNSDTQISISKENNPIEIYRTIKEQGWVGLVLGERELSDKVLSDESVVSKRELRQGSSDNPIQVNMADYCLYGWYLGQQFGNYSSVKEGRCLDYEMEYIVAGGSSDRDNIAAVVLRLLAIRELCNISTIVTNETMVQQAYAVAVSIAGVTGMPAIIEPVKIAVIAIWALLESILDVRALVNGKKIPIMKTYGEWTSRVENLGSCLSMDASAKESENGIGYGTYLYIFLILIGDSNRAYRPMDLIEQTLRSHEGFEETRMDNMAYEMNINLEIQGEPILYSFMPLQQAGMELYQCNAYGEISYIL